MDVQQNSTYTRPKKFCKFECIVCVCKYLAHMYDTFGTRLYLVVLTIICDICFQTKSMHCSFLKGNMAGGSWAKNSKFPAVNRITHRKSKDNNGNCNMLMDLLNTNNGYCYRVCRYILDICVACCRQVPWCKQEEYSAIPRGCSDASHSVYHQVLCGVQSPCRADPSNARWGSCQGYTQAMDACEWCDAHIITLPPLPCLDERTQLSAKRSPLQRQTLTRPSWWSRQNLDSSVNNTWDHCCLVHRTCCLAHVNLACLCPSFRRGFMAVFLDLNPLLWSRFRTVCTESPWRGFALSTRISSRITVAGLSRDRKESSLIAPIFHCCCYPGPTRTDPVLHVACFTVHPNQSTQGRHWNVKLIGYIPPISPSFQQTYHTCPLKIW